jgi:YD repeat-containing protein
MAYLLKDPGARVDYGFDWNAEGQLAGRTITAAAWAVAPTEPGGAAVAASRIEGGVARVTVEGGIAGRVYRLTCRATLSDGETDERQLALRVEDR